MTSSRLWPRVILMVLALATMGGGLLWWAFFQGGDSEINAQELFESACEQSQAESYDLTITRTWSWDDSEEIGQGYTAVVQVSGDDFYMIMDGEFEYMEVGDTAYFRATTDPIYPKWYLLPYDYRFPLRTHPYGTATDLCPELGPVANVGQESVGSANTQRLRATLNYVYEDRSRVNEETGEKELYDLEINNVWDFWVDDGGMLVQTLKEQEKESLTKWTLTKVSGVGQPNVITAPASSTVVLYED